MKTRTTQRYKTDGRGRRVSAIRRDPIGEIRCESAHHTASTGRKHGRPRRYQIDVISPAKTDRHKKGRVLSPPGAEVIVCCSELTDVFNFSTISHDAVVLILTFNVSISVVVARFLHFRFRHARALAHAAVLISGTAKIEMSGTLSDTSVTRLLDGSNASFNLDFNSPRR